MSREYLSIEQLRAAQTIPDIDPFRLSEAKRIYSCAQRGRMDIYFKLLDDTPSGFQSPTEEYREFLDYLSIFDGVLTGLHREFGNSLKVSAALNSLNDLHSIDFEAMRIDISALNYARRYLGIKDCA